MAPQGGGARPLRILAFCFREHRIRRHESGDEGFDVVLEAPCLPFFSGPLPSLVERPGSDALRSLTATAQVDLLTQPSPEQSGDLLRELGLHPEQIGTRPVESFATELGAALAVGKHHVHPDPIVSRLSNRAAYDRSRAHGPRYAVIGKVGAPEL